MENCLLDAAMIADAAGKAIAPKPITPAVPQESSERGRERTSVDTFYSFAFPVCRRLAPVNPLIGYYHLISERELPHVKELYSFKTPAEFKEDIDFLLRCFKPISLKQILAALNDKETLPANAMHLTFDDGLTECFEVAAPILQEKGVPATFFLCSAFVDNKELAYDHKKSLLVSRFRKQSWSTAQKTRVRDLLAGVGVKSEDLATALLSVKHAQSAVLDGIAECVGVDFSEYLEREKPFLSSEQVFKMLHAGHSIGSHSIDHPRYSEIPLAEQLRQTLESSRFVRERFGLDYSAFSFPHSDAEVSLQFFRGIFESGGVGVSFGNRGLLDDTVEKNLQRITLEKPRAHARAILGRGYARRLARIVRRQARVPRS
jgi:peptidoglycan/xylan/chitin deacetylase (PgdA/CDA1 family)